jgi:hypothetical protein
MKLRLLPCLLILFSLLIAGVSATTSTAEISITNYSIEPSYLFTGDNGKLTVTIQNTGEASINIYSAQLDPPTGNAGFKILNDQVYDSVGAIGPGDTRMFTFTFRADCADGVYYPKFYLDLGEDGCFRQYIPVEVKSNELTVTVSGTPDSFNKGVESAVNISVGNPRQGTVNGVTVTPVGDGISVTPKTAFIGSLATDGSKEVKFAITPSKETSVTFLVAYRNGMNDHETSVTLPITFSDDKLSAEPVLNNVEVTNSGQYSTVTGDITNAGLTNAYSITVTVGSPATPVDPNKIYVLGELEPDDFSSFEVTYTASGSTIPVIVTYKDADGNTFTRTFEVTSSGVGMTAIQGSGASSSGSSASSGTQSGGPGGGPGGGGGFLFGMGSRSGSGSSIPFMQIGIALVVVLVVVAVAWKKGYIRKLKERIPRRKPKEDEDDLPNR